ERQRAVEHAVAQAADGREQLGRAADTHRAPDVPWRRPDRVERRMERNPERACDPCGARGRAGPRDAVPVEEVEAGELAPAPASELHPAFAPEDDGRELERHLPHDVLDERLPL